MRITQIASTVQKKTHGRVVELVDAGDAARPADGIDILDHRFDDHIESQGHDGQVVAAGLERGDGDDQADQSGADPAQQDGQREKPGEPGSRGMTFMVSRALT